MTCMPASLQYSFVVDGGNSAGSATHLFRISSSSGSSTRIDVKPSQSHCRPVPLMNPSIVLATSSRVRFIIYPENRMSPEKLRCKPALAFQTHDWIMNTSHSPKQLDS